MQLSDAGLRMIMREEGYKNAPYQDTRGLWTIGVGHLMDQPKSPAELTAIGAVHWSDQQVMDTLRLDVGRFEAAVNGVGVGLSQPSFDALVCLAFNIGVSAFAGSTVARCLSTKDWHGASQAILMWSSHGVLTARRAREQAVFNYGLAVV